MLTVINAFVIGGIGFIFGAAAIFIRILRIKKRATFYISGKTSEDATVSVVFDTEVEELIEHRYILVEVKANTQS